MTNDNKMVVDMYWLSYEAHSKLHQIVEKLFVAIYQRIDK